MNYSASVVDEVAPAGSKAPPPARVAEAAALGQAEKEARRAESRSLAIAAQGGDLLLDVLVVKRSRRQ